MKPLLPTVVRPRKSLSEITKALVAARLKFSGGMLIPWRGGYLLLSDALLAATSHDWLKYMTKWRYVAGGMFLNADCLPTRWVRSLPLPILIRVAAG